MASKIIKIKNWSLFIISKLCLLLFVCTLFSATNISLWFWFSRVACWFSMEWKYYVSFFFFKSIFIILVLVGLFLFICAKHNDYKPLTFRDISKPKLYIEKSSTRRSTVDKLRGLPCGILRYFFTVLIYFLIDYFLLTLSVAKQ